MKRQLNLKGTWIVGLLLALVIGLSPISSLAGGAGVNAAPDSQTTVSGSIEATNPGGDSDWWATAQEQIRRSEYHVTWQEQTYLEDVTGLSVEVTTGAYQAPNRAQNLRTYFAPEGLVIIPRIWPEEIEAPPWRWEVKLSAWGREGALQFVSPAELQIKENHIEYRRSAPASGPGLVEWYHNDEKGLEQGFVLASPPPGGQPEGVLQLDLAVGGDLIPEMVQDGTEIEFRDQEGKAVLRYSFLHVTDATGQVLPAWLSLQGSTLSLFVDDTGATYPIEVDPAITGLSLTEDWFAAFGQADAQLGYSVATAGDVNGDGYSEVIVGVPHYDGGDTEEGTAVIYYGSATGLEGPFDAVRQSNQAEAHFGYSVATAGDVNGDGFADVIVGVPGYRVTTTQMGAVYVYYGSSSGLGTSPDRFLPGAQTDAEFGHSVATAGDVNGDGYSDVIVGAPFYNGGSTEEGRVYVYHGSDSGLNSGSEWRAESNQVTGLLGMSAATAGDVNNDGYADVIVGAKGYNNGQTFEGAAFVWHGSENGVNNDVDGNPSNAAWMVESNYAEARLGTSVSTAGDVNGDGYADVVVGAPFYTSGQTYEGAFWVYYGSDSGLDESWNDSVQSDLALAELGYSIATAGDVNGDGYADVIVGARHFEDTQEMEGAAFVWHGSSAGMSESNDWIAMGGQQEACFGSSVATAGDVNGDGYSDVIVGAPGNASYAGKAYVYHGAPSSLGVASPWTKVSDMAEARFGFAVGTAGDVNGDGYADVVVGAPYWDGGQAEEGAAFVYHGRDGGLNSAPAWSKEAGQAGAHFGYSVGTAGDVNGNGCDDLIVGAPGWDNGQTDEGVAIVYYGQYSGLDLEPAWFGESNLESASFGRSVGTAGDVNGDGYLDVIVGAPFVMEGAGMAFVYFGSGEGLNEDSRWFHVGMDNANYGHSVGTAGDVDRDGYSDIIVGAPGCAHGQDFEGCAYVHYGSAEGIDPYMPWEKESDQLGAKYGWSVGTAGDVNGDGYADVIVGAPFWHDGQTFEGAAWVYHGSASGVNDDPDWYRPSNQVWAEFGYSVGTAGDVNGDGYADVIVGARRWTQTDPYMGAAFAYHGSADGLSTSRDWRTVGRQSDSYYGLSVGTAGDVNGDGYADVIVGAPEHRDNHTREGKAYLYYGNDGPGISLLPRQRRLGTGYPPLAHLGRSDTQNGFFVQMLGVNSPFGRGRVLLEAEVKPLDTPFDGSNTWQSPNYFWMYPGTDYGLGWGGLDADTAYHWRARWRYDPVTTPWMPASRWVTVPWNGWNEADLRTAGTGGGADFWIFLPTVLRNYD